MPMLPDKLARNKGKRNGHDKAFAYLTVISVLSGLVFGLSPAGQKLDQHLSLNSLFNLRGPIAPPPNVLVAAMDRESSDALGVPNLPRKWSREIHGRLVETLADDGVPTIGFDVHFWEPHDKREDQRFADALKTADNVILFQRLIMEDAQGAQIVKRIPPIPLFKNSALDTAPFTLPKVPARVSQAWLFGEFSDDAATMPLTMLHTQLRPLLPAFIEQIQLAADKANITLPPQTSQANMPLNPGALALELRHLLATPGLETALSQQLNLMPDNTQTRWLKVWTYSLTIGDSIYLNFYGPARSIQTAPYHTLLEHTHRWQAPPSETAVFVGFSEVNPSEQQDGFYTAFTGSDGIDISGVEIMATTLANLFSQQAIRPISNTQAIGIIIVAGVVFSIVLLRLPGIWCVTAACGLGGAYLFASYTLFVLQYQLTPLLTPLLIQLPLALLGAILIQQHRSKKRAKTLGKEFGRFVPADILSQLENQTNDMPLVHGKLSECTLLFLDMQGYTSFAETRKAEHVHQEMNRFFATAYPPIEQSGGIVTDMGGDSMVAVWPATDPTTRTKACLAALEIHRLLGEDFVTRTGLHCGEVYLGTIGSDAHLEYRAVGDAVNTTKRIETANKVLGTAILASEQVVSGLAHPPAFYLGKFILKGKSIPVGLYELEGSNIHASEEIRDLMSNAVDLAQSSNGTAATTAFSELARYRHPAAVHYLHLINEKDPSAPARLPFDSKIDGKRSQNTSD